MTDRALVERLVTVAQDRARQCHSGMFRLEPDIARYIVDGILDALAPDLAVVREALEFLKVEEDWTPAMEAINRALALPLLAPKEETR